MCPVAILRGPRYLVSIQAGASQAARGGPAGGPTRTLATTLGPRDIVQSKSLTQCMIVRAWAVVWLLEVRVGAVMLRLAGWFMYIGGYWVSPTVLDIYSAAVACSS